MKIQGMDESAYLTGGPKPGLELEILDKPEPDSRRGVAVVARYNKDLLHVEVLTTKGYEGLYADRQGLHRYYIDCTKSWVARLSPSEAVDLSYLLQSAARIVNYLTQKDGQK